jgi:4-diphosphocytidyl-2-C-methyl-D-erythritol kinase
VSIVDGDQPTRVLVRAPAKVNLHLAVGGVRRDGFHELATVFQALDLADEITARSAPPGTMTVRTVDPHGQPVPGVPDDADHLAVRAARALAGYAGCRSGVHLEVRKRIPVAGGMAGGSADAGAALVACDALWGLGLGRRELEGLAARLGSDVPFSLLGGTALGVGRGERLTPVLASGRWWWVVAVADGGLATPAVYRRLDALRQGQPVPRPRVPDAILAALRAGEPGELGPLLHNDLQPAAVAERPMLGELLELALELGALGALVSGSGPTCLALGEHEAHARSLATALQASGLCERAFVAAGPAPGARQVA